MDTPDLDGLGYEGLAPWEKKVNLAMYRRFYPVGLRSRPGDHDYARRCARFLSWRGTLLVWGVAATVPTVIVVIGLADSYEWIAVAGVVGWAFCVSMGCLRAIQGRNRNPGWRAFNADLQRYRSSRLP